MRLKLRWLGVAALLAAMAGCHGVHIAPVTQPTGNLTGLSAATPNRDVEAIVSPPLGWRADPVKSASNHVHQVWVSPTGDTAYGVIRVWMPLPVGPDLALEGFLRSMRADQGESRLISKEKDRDLPGVRFVAEGGLYRIHGNMITHGFAAWVVYSGVLRARPVNEAELEISKRAREATIVGLPEE